MPARAKIPTRIDLVDVTQFEPSEGVPPWQDPAWLDAVSAWIDEHLTAAGFARSGTPTLRGRAWSVVVRVPVEHHTAVWFKANPPGSAFEPALIAALAQWTPQLAPQLLAVDTRRAWSLTADAGTHLREPLTHDPDPQHLLPLIHRYTHLQRALAAQPDQLPALRLPDQRPHLLPSHLETLLANPATQAAVGEPDSISETQYNALAEFAPTLREHCRELDALGIPASLDHGDLHPSNVFGYGDGARPFDWGDASLAHPFSTLLVLLRSLAPLLNADDLATVRSAYLKPWLADGYRAADLERAAALAMRVTPVLRALAWTRVFPCFANSVEPNVNACRWLARLLADDPLSGVEAAEA